MNQEVRALRISKRFLIYTIMAKELPYFKFEPSEWDNGIIQMCSRESKGLFIDICAMYWSRLGNLPYKLVLQKLCNGNAIREDKIRLDKIREKNRVYAIENCSPTDDQKNDFEELLQDEKGML